MTIAKFKKTIWAHYAAHGRKMPWRETRDPYRVLVSEIMLQQTQVDRVRGFYENFIKRFPTFAALADAPTAEVLKAWQGLGYNRRALALQRLAQAVASDYGGKLPKDRDTLESLPGIGPGTSGSLMAFAFNEPVAFIETNIRRVFIHFFFEPAAGSTPRSRFGEVGSVSQLVDDDEILPLVEKAVDLDRPREWYWALMDYGTVLAVELRAQKIANPNVRSRHYAKQSKFVGSDREIRGKLLRLLLDRKKINSAELENLFPASRERILRIADAMAEEGFIAKRNSYFEMA